MAATGLQSQFRRSPPYASCIARLPDCGHHDAFTTPTFASRRSPRFPLLLLAGAAAAQEQRSSRRLPRQSVQPRRAAGAAAHDSEQPPASAAAQWRRPTPAISRAPRPHGKCAAPAHRHASSNCSTATSSSRCSSSACRTTPNIASSSWAPRADRPPARPARDGAAGAGQCAAGRRARQPLRRVRSRAASECARRAARARQRSGGRPDPECGE